MQMQGETKSIGKIMSQPALRAAAVRGEPRPAMAMTRHDLGDALAALDDHRVFRKAD